MSVVFGIALCQTPDYPGEPAAEALALLEGEGWAPAGATLTVRAVTERWWGGADAVADVASAARALVLFARTDDRAQIVAAARNDARADARDALGYFWPGAILVPGGPARRESSLSAGRLAHAFTLVGVPCALAADAGGGVANHCFYRLLLDPDAPPAALVLLPRAHTPQAHLCNLLAAATALTFAAAAVAAPRLACQRGQDSLPAVHGTPRRAHLRRRAS